MILLTMKSQIGRRALFPFRDAYLRQRADLPDLLSTFPAAVHSPVSAWIRHPCAGYRVRCFTMIGMPISANLSAHAPVPITSIVYPLPAASVFVGEPLPAILTPVPQSGSTLVSNEVRPVIAFYPFASRIVIAAVAPASIAPVQPFVTCTVTSMSFPSAKIVEAMSSEPLFLNSLNAGSIPLHAEVRRIEGLECREVHIAERHRIRVVRHKLDDQDHVKSETKHSTT